MFGVEQRTISDLIDIAEECLSELRKRHYKRGSTPNYYQGYVKKKDLDAKLYVRTCPGENGLGVYELGIDGDDGDEKVYAYHGELREY